MDEQNACGLEPKVALISLGRPVLSGLVCAASEQDKAVQVLLVTCLKFIISLLKLQL